MKLKSKVWILLFALVHFVILVACFAFKMSKNWERFDAPGGIDVPVTFFESVADDLMRILGFPLATLAMSFGKSDGVVQAATVLNSLLWGIFFWFAFNFSVKVRLKNV